MMVSGQTITLRGTAHYGPSVPCTKDSLSAHAGSDEEDALGAYAHAHAHAHVWWCSTARARIAMLGLG